MAWINVGRIQLDIKYPFLPLTSVDQCPAAESNDTLPWQHYNTDGHLTAVVTTENMVTTYSSYVTPVSRHALRYAY